ncbi:autophagy-related protein 3 [Cucumis sativus]|uniref:autophagy-related protein 3 n=1 Tax=Cucumis sativus TaxID=3659 RepID=UPI0002B42A8B|nr:autophagy-related protein 3 [Cucumis sativus]KAE8649136.1 hypothetical protein Csa_014617 [Cucumis sativus]
MVHWFGIFRLPSQNREKTIVFTEADFITAGNFLVGNSDSWSWESGDLSKQKSNLPSDKQFLILRNAPCLRRAFSYKEEYVIVGSDGEDNARLLSESKDEDNLLSTKELPKPGTMKPITIIPSYFAVDKKEDLPLPYMEKSIKLCSATQESTHRVVHDSEDIICLRTYDISITYDNDHQTFRFWLTGYHEDGRPLQPELIFEDVRQSHVGKTVNIEDHPYLPGKHASVHPKIHGAAVKKMVKCRMSQGNVPEVSKCLSLFLEFVASVFPTIKYDCNIGFD